MTNLRCAELPPGRHDQRLAHMALRPSYLDHQPLHMADDSECFGRADGARTREVRRPLQLFTRERIYGSGRWLFLKQWLLWSGIGKPRLVRYISNRGPKVR